MVYIINTEQREAGVEGFDYADLTDKEAETEREAFTEILGYYILPSQLFDRLAEGVDDNDDLNIELDQAFKAVEQSTANADSAGDFKGLFQDFDVNSNKLGGCFPIEGRQPFFCWWGFGNELGAWLQYETE